MITYKQYKATTERDWLGKKVRLLRATVTNGGTEIPAGATAEIVRKYQGFEIRSEPCPHCGMRVRIKKMPPDALEVVK
jgi:hypothetical protein